MNARAFEMIRNMIGWLDKVLVGDNVTADRRRLSQSGCWPEANATLITFDNIMTKVCEAQPELITNSSLQSECCS